MEYRYECEHCNNTFDVYSGSYDAVTHCPFCGSTVITDNDAEQLIRIDNITIGLKIHILSLKEV